MSWSVSFAHAHKTQPKIVMQAKANEPRVSIERIFLKLARFMPTPFRRWPRFSRTFEIARRTRALFIITSNLFAQSPFQFAFGRINLLRCAR
jgi:hypothetical protein